MTTILHKRSGKIDTLLVDSNVLLDVIGNDSEWGKWSFDAMARTKREYTLAINTVIYAEISVSFPSAEELDRVLPSALMRLDIPYEAAFLAGKCFLKYKRAGGAKRSTLPDFLIGAHAAVTGMPLLTRDITRYQTYFPSLALICPNKM